MACPIEQLEGVDERQEDALIKLDARHDVDAQYEGLMAMMLGCIYGMVRWVEGKGR